MYAHDVLKRNTAQAVQTSESSEGKHTGHIYVYTYIHTYIHKYIYISTYIHIHIHTYIYISSWVRLTRGRF